MSSSANSISIQEMLLPAKSIPAEMRRRRSDSIVETISPRLQEEYESNGWELERRLKTRVRMRRAKPHDVAFEDRVWAALASLGFTSLNRDRNFILTYGAQAGERKQIDIFAADDDVVLLVECKSSATVRQRTFKTEIESIQGMRPGLIRTIGREFPGHKIRPVLATRGLAVTNMEVERIEAAGVLYMDEDTIEYYEELGHHLGGAARYQILGNLLAGRKIPGLEATVPAIRGRMGGHTYYTFLIEPARLLKLGFILHRAKANHALMPTYQRLIKRSRLKQVSEFIDADGIFPNSLILNIEGGKRGLRFDLAPQGGAGKARLGLLHLPQTYRAAYVIDGQHRLYGYADSPRANSDLVPVVAFVDLPRVEQVSIFMQINENQKAVSKTLRNTLNADLLWDSSDFREQQRALKLRIAQHLGESRTSPLYGRVLVGESQRSLQRAVTIDAISVGLDRGNFLGVFGRTEVKEAGTFYKGTNQATFDVLVPFLEESFRYFMEALPGQADVGLGEGGFVFINNGVESLVRIFSDVVDYLVRREGVNCRTMATAELMELAIPLFEPLGRFLQGRSPEEAADLRRSYGTAGRTRYWRKLQEAIHEAWPEFTPPGLEQFKQDEARTFNTETFGMIRELEQFLNRDIRERLVNEFGEMWFKQGVPLKTYQAASALAVDKNREKDPHEEVEPWECLVLIDYHKIVTQQHDLWQRLFAKRYTRPGDETKAGGWQARASWMVELNRIRNENDHTYTVTEEEYDWVVGLTRWLIRGEVDNELPETAVAE